MYLKKVLLKIVKTNLLKTLYVNFSQFGFKGLWKLPVMLEYGVRYRNKGKIVAANSRINMLTIKSKTKIEIRENGKLILHGSHSVFNSYLRIIIGENAKMELGNNFSTNECSDFNCLQHIVFGNNVVISINVVIMDTDFLKIYSSVGERINLNKEIIIGDNVWIGCKATILKGTKVGSNIIIGACSLLSGEYLDEYSIYAGIPAKKIKDGIRWDY